MERKKKWSVLLGGVGLHRNDAYGQPLRQAGFDISGAFSKTGLLNLLLKQRFDALVLADTISADGGEITRKTGRVLVLQTLAEISEALPAKRQPPVWLILSDPAEASRKDFWRFPFIVEIRHRVAPWEFVLGLERYLANHRVNKSETD